MAAAAASVCRHPTCCFQELPRIAQLMHSSHRPLKEKTENIFPIKYELVSPKLLFFVTYYRTLLSFVLEDTATYCCFNSNSRNSVKVTWNYACFHPLLLCDYWSWSIKINSGGRQCLSRVPLKKMAQLDDVMTVRQSEQKQEKTVENLMKSSDGEQTGQMESSEQLMLLHVSPV